MKRNAAIVATVTLCAVLAAWASAGIPEGVKSVFKQRCAGCHKGTFPSGGLNLEPANLGAIIDKPSKKAPGQKIVDPQAPEASYLLKKARRENGIAGKPMPPGKPLTAEELQALEAWIAGLK
jgi:mono/diheme cytochrome c family protein